jgi:MT0933-like antitoxin protein
MALFRRLAILAGAATAAQQYARRNPDKVNRLATKAGEFVDRRTNGRYHQQITGAVQKVRQSTTGRPGPEDYRSA